MKALPYGMQLALRLQMAFGMRLEESLKFRARGADRLDRQTMQASWWWSGPPWSMTSRTAMRGCRAISPSGMRWLRNSRLPALCGSDRRGEQNKPAYVSWFTLLAEEAV